VKAIATLRQTANVPTGDGSDLPPLEVDEATNHAASVVDIYKKAGATPVPSATDPVLSYTSKLAANLVNFRNFKVPDWEAGLAPYLELLSASPDPKEISRQWLLRSASETTGGGDVPDDEEEGEDLCDYTFSLAYDAKILLNAATLRPKRGYRYGLRGRNGSGKVRICSSCVVDTRGAYIVRVLYSLCSCARSPTAKSRASHPPRKFAPSTWSTISMERKETSVLQSLLRDKRIQAEEAEIIETLGSVGFNKERLPSSRSLAVGR
jgi:elongation factor 3